MAYEIMMLLKQLFAFPSLEHSVLLLVL